MMATYRFSAQWTGYKACPASGDTASTWTEGALRAGVQSGMRYIGAVLFQLRNVVGDITSASITLTRDAAWGEGVKAVQLFPIPSQDISGTETEAESLARGAIGARKEYTTAAGETVLPIAGATLAKMQAGTFAGFILMTQNEGGYSQFTDAITLTVTTESYTDTPIWAREIGAGDIISDSKRWHTEDIDELIFYTNLRAKKDGLAEITWPSEKRGLFKYWGECMALLQNKVNACLTEEKATVKTFTAVAAGDYPKAIVVNELRLALEDKASGYAAGGAYYAYYKKGASKQTWKTGDVTGGGKKVSTWHYEYKEVIVGGTCYEKIEKVWETAYYYYAGFWTFSNIAALKGGEYQNVTLHIKKLSGENTFKLYGTTEPDTVKTVDEIFTADTDAAGYVELTMADGEERDIVLPDTMVEALRSGTIKGFGLKPGGTKSTTLSAAATLF